MIILCHKCAGLLAHNKTDDVTGLLGCQCISGYVRGFEPLLDRSQAIAAQIKRQDSWIDLYTRQNRSAKEIQAVMDKIQFLRSLNV